jgi:hypothetical protein
LKKIRINVEIISPTIHNINTCILNFKERAMICCKECSGKKMAKSKTFTVVAKAKKAVAKKKVVVKKVKSAAAKKKVAKKSTAKIKKSKK